jgi:hypothetical protein
MELLIKEGQDKILLKQRSGNRIVVKKKATALLSPNTPIVLRIIFDGTEFSVLVNGSPILMLTPASEVPLGTVGFDASTTSAAFEYLQVQ